MWTDIWQDLRIGFRGLVRSPGFALTAIVTLGIGLGATSSIYSVVDAVLLRSMPYPEPERLVKLSGLTREGGQLAPFPLSYVDIQDLQKAVPQLEDVVGASDARAFNLLTDGEATHIEGEMVGAGYFKLLGANPRLGRTFSAEEDRVGGERVVLVSEGFWLRQLGGDDKVLQKQLILDGEPARIIGVMPHGFKGISDKAEIWLPLPLASAMFGSHYIDVRSFRWIAAYGKLRPGATITETNSAIDTVMRQFEASYPDSNQNVGAKVTPLRDALFGDMRPMLLALLGASAFVLLIACVNIANLLLFRATGRQREVAIRSALGARKSQIIRQLLSESILLALLGCAVGLLLTPWATALLISVSGMEFKSFLDIGVNLRVTALMTALALLCGVGVGLVPAYIMANGGLAKSLVGSRTGASGFGRQRFQSGLIIAEVALALVLLVGTGLMVRSFMNLLRSDLGFAQADLLTMRFDLKGNLYMQPPVREQLARQVQERLEKLPGVESLALAGPAIPTDEWYGGMFTFEDRRASPGQDAVILLRHHVMPSYFKTMRTPLLKGRFFTMDDAASTQAPPVAILSESAARYLGDLDPVGRRIKFGERSYPSESEGWLTIVGVVGDIGHAGFGSEGRPAPDIYLPMLQLPPGNPPIFNILVRPEGIPIGPLSESLRTTFAEIAPDLPIYDVATMETRLASQAARRRFLVMLVALFGFLGLALVILGIYGVISYAVAQSTREIAVRMALGAEQGKVRGMVVRRALILVGSGIAIGLIAAVGLTGSLQSLLYGVGATDPTTLASVSALMLIVGLLASYLPARRATRIDPMRVLRNE